MQEVIAFCNLFSFCYFSSYLTENFGIDSLNSTLRAHKYSLQSFEQRVGTAQLHYYYCQARVQVGPGQVKARSRSGPGQLHVNSKSFKIKVYFKSLRDLDLELEAIIAMPPPPTHPGNFSEQNNIEISLCMN